MQDRRSVYQDRQRQLALKQRQNEQGAAKIIQRAFRDTLSRSKEKRALRELERWRHDAPAQQHTPPAVGTAAAASQRETTRQVIPFSQSDNTFTPITSSREQLRSVDKQRNIHLSHMEHKRRVFEDLIIHQTQAVMRDSPLLRRQGGVSKPAVQQRFRERRLRVKPDSVIQQLLERFDPLRTPHVKA